MTAVIIITIIAIILFSTELLPVELTSMLVMVTLMVLGIVTPEEGLSGFSNVATISVFALLVLSIGLQSTGVVNYIGEKMEDITGANEWRILFFIIIVVGFLSAFMNNTAIVAIFLPAVIRLADYAKISPSKFLMPLSFAAMIGGASTVIGTSTNILVSSIYQDYSGEAFNIFEFSLLGIFFFVVFILFMFIIGYHIIPNRKGKVDLTKQYNLEDFLTELKVGKGSPMIGKQLKDTELWKNKRAYMLELNKHDGKMWIPNGLEEIHEGDELLVRANIKYLLDVKDKQKLLFKRETALDEKELTSEDAVLFEAVIGQNSFLVGKKVGEVDFRMLFRALPLALRRSGEPLTAKIRDVQIQFGDVLLMEARRSNLSNFYNSRDFIVLEKVKKKTLRRRKMLLSSIIVLGVVLLAAFNILPIVTSALLGCVIMWVTGCMSMRYTYGKMEWRVIFLLAGIIPLGIAVDKTGTSDLIANGILSLSNDAGPTFVVSLLFLITTLLTSFMSNNATAVLLAPIAITIAEQLGMDPKPFLITVMFAASTSFLTPIGYQTNTLVYGIGQYKFADFLKVGGLLTLIIWGLASLLIPLIYF